MGFKIVHGGRQYTDDTATLAAEIRLGEPARACDTVFMAAPCWPLSLRANHPSSYTSSEESPLSNSNSYDDVLVA